MTNKDYKEISTEALSHANDAGSSGDMSVEIGRGTVKSVVGLSMVVGDLKESLKQSFSKLNSLTDSYQSASTAAEKATNFLSWTLIGITAIQVFIGYLEYRDNQKIKIIRQDCYEIAMQQPPFSNSYKACLYLNGLSE